MGTCYPTSLVAALRAPGGGQDPCLVSAVQRQNKRIVSATVCLNPLLLLLTLVDILSPEAVFMTRALLSCCH